MSTELFNDCFIVSLGLQFHSSPLSFKPLNLDLLVSNLKLIWLLILVPLVAVLPVHHLLVSAVLHVDGEALGGQEAEPLERLWIKTYLSKRVLPAWDAQVHDHQPEVVGKAVGHVKPVTAEVLEPDLGLGGATVDEGQAAVLHIGVDLKGADILSVRSKIEVRKICRLTASRYWPHLHQTHRHHGSRCVRSGKFRF